MFKASSTFTAILVILILGCLAYSNSLFNGFFGDDSVLFTQNSFYKSWSNFPRLFKEGYIFDAKALINNTGDVGTGSVSYRPVDNMTYFLDYALWGLKPFGFHLTNLCIHIANMIILYLILIEFQVIWSLALFASLFFGLHPIQSEAICAIGYRADSLACLFVLAGMFCWMKGIRFATLLFYGLAVFTKESAVMFPLIVIIHDRLFNSRSCGRKYYYAGLVSIAAFYLYTYFFIFPNSAIPQNHLFGSTLSEHFLIMQKIFVEYIAVLVMPLKAHLIPALYVPELNGKVAEILVLPALIIGMLLIVLTYARRSRLVTFLFIWFIIFYIPISNLIPLANPIAFRFMYLPSVGFICALALILNDLTKMAFMQRLSTRIGLIIKTSIIVTCVCLTLLLNSLWNNNYLIASMWQQDYPTCSKGYHVLGLLYFQKGDYSKAEEYLLKSVQYGVREKDASVDYYLGVCYFTKGQLARAERHLMMVLNVLPDYPQARHALEEALKRKNE